MNVFDDDWMNEEGRSCEKVLNDARSGIDILRSFLLTRPTESFPLEEYKRRCQLKFLEYYINPPTTCRSGTLQVAEFLLILMCFFDVVINATLRRFGVDKEQVIRVSATVRLLLNEWDTCAEMWEPFIADLQDECARVIVFYVSHHMKLTRASADGGAGLLRFGDQSESSLLMEDARSVDEHMRQREAREKEIEIDAYDPRAWRGLAPNQRTLENFWKNERVQPIIEKHKRVWESDRFIKECARMVYFTNVQHILYSKASLHFALPARREHHSFWQMIERQRCLETTNEFDRFVQGLGSRLGAPLGARHAFISTRFKAEDHLIRSEQVIMNDCGLKYCNGMVVGLVDADKVCRKEVESRARDAALIAIWDRQMRSFCHTEFFGRYIILSDSLHNHMYQDPKTETIESILHPERHKPLLFRTRESGQRRRPIIVQLKGNWYVQNVAEDMKTFELYSAASIEDALVVWSSIMHRDFKDLFADGKSSAAITALCCTHL